MFSLKILQKRPDDGLLQAETCRLKKLEMLGCVNCTEKYILMFH